MTLPHGFNDDGEMVPVIGPEEVFFSGEKRPDEKKDISPKDLALKMAGDYARGLLRSIYATLRDGPPEEMAERAVAIFRDLEIEERGLRAIAAELGISVGNLSQKVNETRAKMNTRIQRRNSEKEPEK